MQQRRSYPCDRPWRPIGVWDLRVPTFSRQSAHRWRWSCQPYAPAGRLLTPGRFLVLISVRGSVDPRAIVRLEVFSQLKNPMTSSRIGPATIRLVRSSLRIVCTAVYVRMHWTCVPQKPAVMFTQFYGCNDTRLNKLN
jgi:hypothetical protein